MIFITCCKITVFAQCEGWGARRTQEEEWVPGAVRDKAVVSLPICTCDCLSGAIGIVPGAV